MERKKKIDDVTNNEGDEHLLSENIYKGSKFTELKEVETNGNCYKTFTEVKGIMKNLDVKKKGQNCISNWIPKSATNN